MNERMNEWKGIIPNILICGLFTLLFFFVDILSTLILYQAAVDKKIMRLKAVCIFFKHLRGSLPKSVPLDFGLEKTFAL